MSDVCGYVRVSEVGRKRKKTSYLLMLPKSNPAYFRLTFRFTFFSPILFMPQVLKYTYFKSQGWNEV